MIRIIVAALVLNGCCVTVPLSLTGGYLQHRDCPASYRMEGNPFPVHPDVTSRSGIRVDAGGHPVDLARLDRQMAELSSCLGEHIESCGFVVRIVDEPPTEGTWRGSVQPPNVILLSPDAFAFKHELIHLVRGAGHDDPAFACQ